MQEGRQVDVHPRVADEADDEGDDQPDVVRLPHRGDGVLTEGANPGALGTGREGLEDADPEVGSAGDAVGEDREGQEAEDDQLAHGVSPLPQAARDWPGGWMPWAWSTCRRHMSSALNPIIA